MKFEILGKPAYSAVKIELESGESITAEAGAMMAMEGDIEVETKTAGGMAKGFEQAGFNQICGLDNFKEACMTYRYNFKLQPRFNI